MISFHAMCLFCRIVKGEIPSRPVYRDDRLYAFHDINPQAPLHVLVVPHKHIATLDDLTEEDDGLVGEMVRRAAAIAREHGYNRRGFRTVFNCNAEAGQSVYHLHLHLLAGRRLGWPPG
jgi:histidine triad (HIT) family protein